MLQQRKEYVFLIVCVVSYFLNDWNDFVSSTTRNLFHENVICFCEALHQHFNISFVLVGGCASMFYLPPAYDDAVNFVIETLRHMGIACNNAPETHQLPLCNDGYHFHPVAEPPLLATWEKVLVERARPSIPRPKMLNRSAAEIVANQTNDSISWPLKITRPAAKLVANQTKAKAVPPKRDPLPPLCNFGMDGSHEF